jgi:hypothetical protein
MPKILLMLCSSALLVLLVVEGCGNSEGEADVLVRVLA